ncbi:hypothetical protein BX666DRAFT_1964249 [Dichotomocladium elegans]|nr:hypothetical protein BX666DRAFT_1964249 [Dichotomocladium elegans]
MYSHYTHPAQVNTIVMTGTIYPQIQPPPPPFMPLRLIQHPLASLPPSEPIPSATDAGQGLDLPLPQLAEFASAMVMLMWHERQPSVLAMHYTSRPSSSFSGHVFFPEPQDTHPGRGIAYAASTPFKNFSRQILHATQLSESVVMLSLKYIAMALQLNPNIQGADGSEYRVFTVALMLANKYLDDNTFTNKTWSEVTGMALTDLNSMESEFLDVLEYNLFVDKDEFKRWKTALVRFKNRHQKQQYPKQGDQAGMSIPSRALEPKRCQVQQKLHYTFLEQPQFAAMPASQQTPSRVLLRIPPPSAPLKWGQEQNPAFQKDSDRNNDMTKPKVDKPSPYLRHGKTVPSATVLGYNAPPAGQYVPTYPSYHHQDFLRLVPANAPPVYATAYYIDPSAYAIATIPPYGTHPSNAATKNASSQNRL